MENFKQLCVWQGVTLGDATVEDFEKFFKEMRCYIVKDDRIRTDNEVYAGDMNYDNQELNVRVKFAEEVKTNGGRHDILFYIHDEDINTFAIKRFSFGIRWWEDVVSYNSGSYLYSEDILNKYPVLW